MKPIRAWAIILAAAASLSAHAQGGAGAEAGESGRAEGRIEEHWKFGTSIGSPIGLTIQAPLPRCFAVRAGAGARSGSDGRAMASIDGLCRFPNLLRVGAAAFAVEFGLGASYQPAHAPWDDNLAVRLPLGIFLPLKSAPVEFGLSVSENLWQSQTAGVDGTDAVLLALFHF